MLLNKSYIKNYNELKNEQKMFDKILALLQTINLEELKEFTVQKETEKCRFQKLLWKSVKYPIKMLHHFATLPFFDYINTLSTLDQALFEYTVFIPSFFASFFMCSDNLWLT